MFSYYTGASDEMNSFKGLPDIRSAVENLEDDMTGAVFDLENGSVDAQFSGSDNILIVATGLYKTSQTQVKKPFFNTFLLCRRSENGSNTEQITYHVKNSVFRALGDALISAASCNAGKAPATTEAVASVSAGAEDAAEEGEAPTLGSEGKADVGNELVAQVAAATTRAQDADRVVTVSSAPTPASTETIAAPEDAAAADESAKGGVEETVVAASAVVGVDSKEGASAAVAEEAGRTVHVVPAPAVKDKDGPPAKLSWATMVATSKPKPAPSKPKPAPVLTPVDTSEATGWEGVSNSKGGADGRANKQLFSIYVKGLDQRSAEKAEKELEELFGTFGTVVQVQTFTNGFAFVDFETQEGMDAALAKSNEVVLVMPGGHKLRAEKRKSVSTPRVSAGGSGSGNGGVSRNGSVPSRRGEGGAERKGGSERDKKRDVSAKNGSNGDRRRKKD